MCACVYTCVHVRHSVRVRACGCHCMCACGVRAFELRVCMTFVVDCALISGNNQRSTLLVSLATLNLPHYFQSVRETARYAIYLGTCTPYTTTLPQWNLPASATHTAPSAALTRLINVEGARRPNQHRQHSAIKAGDQTLLSAAPNRSPKYGRASEVKHGV